MARPKLTKEEKIEKDRLKKLGLIKCRTCQENKKNIEFPKNGDGYRGDCLLCYNHKRRLKIIEDPVFHKKRRSQYRKSYYKNRETIIKYNKRYNKENPEKVKKWQKIYREKCKKEYIEFKSNLKCSICGYDKDPRAIDMHHVEEKLYSISKILYCKNKLKTELEKCIPVCANCHRIIHKD